MIKGIILFAGGAAVGAAASYLYFTKKGEHDFNQRVQEEVERELESEHARNDELIHDLEKLRDSYVTKTEEKEEKPKIPKIDAPVVEKVDIPEMKQYTEKTDYSGAEASAEAKAMKRKKKAPYIITKEMFDNECQHYGKEELDYYLVDRVLADSDDNLVDISAVGDAAIKSLHANPKEVVYVRNDKLTMDYEIYAENGSHSEYGDDNAFPR